MSRRSGGVVTFSGDLLHPFDDRHLIHNRPLEPGAVGFLVLESAGIGHVLAAEPIAPAERGLIGQIVLLAQGPDRQVADLGLACGADDLLAGESLLSWSSPCLLRVEKLQANWRHDPSQTSWS